MIFIVVLFIEKDTQELSQHLLVQRQQWKYENNVRSLLTISNKDTESRQSRRFGAFIVNLEEIL